MSERWLARLSRVLNHESSGRQPLILYASPAEFQQTNAIGGDIGEGTGGVTEALRRRIVLPVGGTLADLDHVIGHELVHAFQYDMTGSGRAMPLWFIEGMAEYLSLGPIHAPTAMWMRGAIQDTGKDTLPSFRQLEDPRYFPYRYGHALLSYVAGQWGDRALGQLLRRAGRRRGVDQAIREVLAIHPDTLVARWHAAVHATYEPLLPGTRPAESFGQRIIAARRDGRYNIAPSLSPDGSRMMFLSDRDLFSIELFLADARTGKIERQVTETAVDPHLQSLEFIESSGSWSPDGKRFVFAGLSGGSPILVLYDVDRDDREREIRLPQLGQALNPSWSPDGRFIAFSGVAGGLTDLYIVDLENDQVRRLTNDQFADLQPAWSPDGQSLAFATDRFTTTLKVDVQRLPVEWLRSLWSRQSCSGPGRADYGLSALFRQSHAGRSSSPRFGRPSLAVGGSQFGTYVGGGASLYFSDLLGDHNLVTGLNVQGSLKDVNALVGYQNLRSRLNWGAVAQQTPYLSGAFFQGTSTVDGQTVLVNQELLERQTNRDIDGMLAYPFSQVQRIEFQAGFTNITFDRELRTRAFSFQTGEQLLEDEEDLPAGEAINMAVASAALVYDNSFGGPTGPLFGQRYRFEISPTAGSLSYLNILGDFRRYFMPVRPFTFATRILHYGRYGRGGESDRLQPLFPGYPGLVRALQLWLLRCVRV